MEHSQMSPLGGDYINSDGEVVNLDGGAPNRQMSPFNGNFISSDGSIKNIDQLGGGGSGGDAHKIPALADLEFATDVIPAGRVLTIGNTTKKPAITNDGLHYRARAVEGTSNQYFGLWTINNRTNHFGLFELTSATEIQVIQDWFDGTNWVSNQYLVKQGITGEWQGDAEYTGLVLETSPTDITVDAQPEMDLVDVDTKATQGLSELSLNRATRQEIDAFVGTNASFLTALKGQSIVPIINKLAVLAGLAKVGPTPSVPIPDDYTKVAEASINGFSNKGNVSLAWVSINTTVIQTTGMFCRVVSRGDFIFNFYGNADISSQAKFMELITVTGRNGAEVVNLGELFINGNASQIITNISTNIGELVFKTNKASVSFGPAMKMEIYYKP